jgi:ATPase subunit of ABC transporter with duplicated ATPase domains
MTVIFYRELQIYIVEVDNGHLYQYDGDYADYLEQREMRREQAMASEQKRQNFCVKKLNGSMLVHRQEVQNRRVELSILKRLQQWKCSRNMINWN